MDIFRAFDVSATGMLAQKKRMNTIASNLANINTTRTPEGGPYRRRDVVFETLLIDESQGIEGVRVRDVVEDQSPFRVVYDPGHPDADEKGFVKLPNVDLIEEMVNMMLAVRGYEANVNAFNITKSLYQKSLEIGK